MNILQEAYVKKLTETDRNIRFWEDYLQSLKSLDFSQFSGSLKVPALVPMGTRILFRGELKHTNEVTVAMGADYFVKCSLSQADVLRQHRIQGAQAKLDLFVKEKEYFENQMNFTKSNIYDMEGHEIVENYTEEEDRSWRQKHRENIRQYKQNTVKEHESEVGITDEELWNRLEELELQEELEGELKNMHEGTVSDKEDSFVIKEDNIQIKLNKEKEDKTKTDKENENENKKRSPPQTSKVDLLQQVINRQNELENKLFEIKNRETKASQNENDLINKLDEMEHLDELEDEMDRLDDIIQNDDLVEDIDDGSIKSNTIKIERRVSFIDNDDNQTLELTFEHSKVEPNNLPYDTEKGILKPSDIYKAYAHLFNNETMSILKKSKYESFQESLHEITKNVQSEPMITVDSATEPEVIVIKDVIEKDEPCNKLGNSSRPTSLFKKKRMQNKS